MTAFKMRMHPPVSLSYSSTRTLKPSSLKAALLTLPLVGASIALVWYVVDFPQWTLEAITGIAAFSAIYGLALSIVLLGRSLNFVSVYGTYLSLSHLGLVITYVLSPTSLYQSIMDAGLQLSHLRWFFEEQQQSAVAIAGMGISAFFLGAIFLDKIVYAVKPKVGPPTCLNHRHQRTIFGLGIVLLIICSSYLLWAFVSGSLPLFSGYSAYREMFSVLPGYPTFLGVFSLAIAFTSATGSPRQVYRWIGLILIPAALLIVTGNRGEVLYALAASAAILGVRGARFGYRFAITFVLIFLVIIPLVRKLRDTPLPEVDLKSASVSLADPFVELGYQLRPLIATLQWIDNGEEYAFGGTYFLPIRRMISLSLPMVERPSLDDNRFYIGSRLPGQGYTVIAEAYFNFGWLGVVVILGALGAFFATANRTTSLEKLALFGAIAAVLLNNQRNAFIFVPGQVTIILMLYFGTMVIARSIKEPPVGGRL